jgi:DsbC/DsbD-like thiol-disulfide interchange protein
VALAARSDWSQADESQLRLMLVAGENGRIEGGIEIQLEPEWYTYWRNPGEAGVPPIFDFSGSENVAHVEVRYPAPVRYDDGASVSLIYRDEVVFPLSVTPVETEQPVTLRLDARFGVCSAICIPTAAKSEVTFAPGAAADPLSLARLGEFARRIPKEPEPGRFDVESATPDGDALNIDVRMPDSTYSDLFAEPPAGWYIGQPAFVERVDGVSRYRLSLAGRPPDAELRGQKFRFVAVAGGEAIEESVEIR